MSEMLRRVISAIDDVLGDTDESLSIEVGCGSQAKKWRAENMEKAALAALKAMMEPSESMIERGSDAMKGLKVTPPDKFDTLRIGYKAMIDAALDTK